MTCHWLCSIGPRRDHHGSSEYRCIDPEGKPRPWPGEPEYDDLAPTTRTPEESPDE